MSDCAHSANHVLYSYSPRLYIDPFHGGRSGREQNSILLTYAAWETAHWPCWPRCVYHLRCTLGRAARLPALFPGIQECFQSSESQFGAQLIPITNCIRNPFIAASQVESLASCHPEPSIHRLFSGHICFCRPQCHHPSI